MKFLPAFRYFLHNWQLQMQIFWNWIHVFRNSTKPLNLFRTQGSTFITRVLNKSQSFKPLHSSWKLIRWKNIWNKSIVLPIWAVQNLLFFCRQSQVWDTNNCRILGSKDCTLFIVILVIIWVSNWLLRLNFFFV